ncbi:hypothetical protein [Legionella londiniensis]|nr:hypothetical protein [Legionella londiniensis]
MAVLAAVLGDIIIPVSKNSIARMSIGNEHGMISSLFMALSLIFDLYQ